MKYKILEIIQKNYKEYKGSNEAELASAEEIKLLFEKEVLKGKIEVLGEIDLENKSQQDNNFGNSFKRVRVKIDILQQQLKKLNNVSN